MTDNHQKTIKKKGYNTSFLVVSILCMFALCMFAVSLLKANTLHGMIISALVVILGLFLIFVHRIVRWRMMSVYHLTAEANDIMQHALDVCDNYVIRLNLSTLEYTNVHGHLLPEENMSRDEFYKHLKHEHEKESMRRIGELLSGKLKMDEGEISWNKSLDKEEWMQLHCLSIVERKSSGQAVAIISTLTDVTQDKKQLTALEELAEEFKLIFEKSVVGMSFYTPNGHLLDANEQMREICVTENADKEYFLHVNLYDMSPFDELMPEHKPEDISICYHSQLLNKYLELATNIIDDDEGNIQFIAITARDVTVEHDMYLQYRHNQAEIRKTNSDISQYESQLKYLLNTNKMLVWRSNSQKRTVQYFTNLNECIASMDFDEFKGRIIDDTGYMDEVMANPEKYFSQPFSCVKPTRNLVYKDDKVYWYAMSSVPRTDANGNHTGCFGVIRDVTTIMEEQQRLKEETQRANDSGQMKSVFLANMTHEIRTPLNSIIGFSDLLQAVDTQEERAEMTKIIRNNCDVLIRLIDDILSISTMNEGGLDIHPKDMDLASAFDEMYQSLTTYINEPIEFLRDNPYRVCRVKLDKERLLQVITNFVTNAVKNTSQGHIRIGYRQQDNGIYFYCEDTGKGIPKDKCDKIFERFVKLNDYVQGAGLGLSICKAIAQRSNGRIGVDSEVGKGSTFWLWTPCEITEIEDTM
jgi:PAS domain-containing protein